MKTITTCLMLSALLLSGCASVGLQSKRIFQEKVPDPVVDAITEDIRQAADWLDKSPEVTGQADVVASDLKGRVGHPERIEEHPEKIGQNLRKASVEHRDESDELMDWLREYRGEKIEGSGLSVWGIGGALVIVGLIVLVVLVPALIPLVIQVVQLIAGTSRRVLKETVSATTAAIEEWGTENPDEFDKLKEKLGRKQGPQHKMIIKKAKDGTLS